MNTEALKFRVWDKEKKSYRLDLLLGSDGFLYGYEEWKGRDPQKYIVERCTGLLDKNGKLIYEGDVLDIGLPGLELGTVYWSNGRFLALLKQDKRTGATITHYFDRQQFEIVGNIHEVKNENS